MQNDSSSIVIGKVVAVSSKTKKSEIEKNLLIARDRIYKITLKLSSVEKDKVLQVGSEFIFEAWRPSIRFPPLPGPQGHHPIPKKDDYVKAFLIKKDDVYRAFMPNGIEIIKKVNSINLFFIAM